MQWKFKFAIEINELFQLPNVIQCPTQRVLIWIHAIYLKCFFELFDVGFTYTHIWYDVKLRSAPLGNFCFSLKCCKNLFTMPPVYTVIIASWRVTCYDKKASISIKQTPERTMLLVNPCLDAFLRVKINWGALFRTWMIWLPYHFDFCSVPLILL